MNKCSICEKPIQEPATECSTRCVMEANQKGQAKITQARSSYTESMRKMMTPDTGRLPKQPEVSMFYVKHRVLKNRSMQHRELVLAFNEKGYAAIQDLGNNRRWAEEAVLNSRGNLELLESLEKLPEPAQEPAIEEVVTITTEEAKAEGMQEEAAAEQTEEQSEEEIPLKRPGKKSTKKPVGKKPTKK